MRPMLATQGRTVPSGPAWAHEVKWDGMRVIATVSGGRLRLTSRNENDVSVSFPELAALAEPEATGGHDLVLDGEVVALDNGVPRFAALAERLHVSQSRRAERLAQVNPVTLMIFDLLSLDGLDLTALPLAERRARLDGLGLGGPSWRVPEVYDDGDLLRQATQARGLEGIVSKRLDSPYRAGRRSRDWLKFPHRPTGSYVVGGWRPETGSASRLGAVLVGVPTPTGLRYRGRVGSGIAGRAGPRLLERLGPLVVPTSPFTDDVPRVDALGTVWVRPDVVVEVAALGLTPQGRLRQPAYAGMRPDLSADDLAEEPAEDPGGDPASDLAETAGAATEEEFDG